MSAYDLLKQQASELIAQTLGHNEDQGGSTPAEAGADHHGFLNDIIGMVQSRGLGSLTRALQDKGMGEQVRSWIGRGENLPVSSAQIRDALGSEQVAALAKKYNLPIDQASAMLAKFLPHVVDRLTPNGNVDDPQVESAEPKPE